jgi:CheY-like chemotaxis protein
MLNTPRNPQATILYIAPDSVARAVRTEALQKAGFHVRLASTGTEALANLD